MTVCKHFYISWAFLTNHSITYRAYGRLYTPSNTPQTRSVADLWDVPEPADKARHRDVHMDRHSLLLVNGDAFYQSTSHALDLGYDCGLIQDHIRCLLHVFLVLRTIVNNVSVKA